MNYKNLIILFCASIVINISFAGKEKNRKHLSAPTILRKDTDQYIDELLRFLDEEPQNTDVVIPETFADYLHYLTNRVVRIEKSVDQYGNIYLDKYEDNEIVYFVKKTKTAHNIETISRENLHDADDFEYLEGVDAHLKWKKMKRLYQLQREINEFKGQIQN